MDAPDSLREKVERLEQEVETVKDALPPGAKPIQINRRSFLLTVGGAATAGAAAGRVAAQSGSTESDVSARAQIIGNGAPPDPSSEFFENKVEYHYEYLDRDTGARWVIEDGDSGWTMLPVKTNQLTLKGPSSSTQESLLDAVEDNDETTVFDHDTGQLTEYNVYLVRGWLAGDESAAIKPLKVRVNGVSTANYNYHGLNGGTGFRTTGDTEWQVDVNQNETIHVELLIRGAVSPTSTTTAVPSFTNRGSAHDGNRWTANGRLTVDEATVNQIRVWTGFQAVGQLAIYGLDVIA